MLHRIFCLLAATLLLMTGVCAGAENQFVFSFMPTRQHEGVTYEGRTTNSLTTVLLLGYDHKDEGELDVPQEGFIRGGQSDFMLLLVVDHDAKKSVSYSLTVIPLPRSNSTARPVPTTVNAGCKSAWPMHTAIPRK